jgi:hypothetical protein
MTHKLLRIRATRKVRRGEPHHVYYLTRRTSNHPYGHHYWDTKLEISLGVDKVLADTLIESVTNILDNWWLDIDLWGKP